MAPKQPKQTTPFRRVKKDSTTATKAKEKDPWKGCPKVSCDACKQTTRSVDRQSRPESPKFLYWVQSRHSKKLRRNCPSGKECYPCYFVRRKHFNCCPQTKLVESMKESPAVEDKVMEVRADHVGGWGKLKKEGWIDIESLVEKQEEEDYHDRFVEGSFEPLWEFAEKRGLKADDGKALTQLVMDRYPSYVVGYDKSDLLAVEIPDSTGQSYRYRRGAKDSVQLRRIEKAPDEDDAKERFGTLVDKRRIDNTCSQLETAEGDGDDDDSDDAKAMPRGPWVAAREP